MDTAQWPQGIGVLTPIEKKPRPQKEQALNCPRCNSTNTKFCYYNNYSLTQPRYFCKTCRRYWTEGGSLRNVPVGGGSRKNKRSTSSSPSSSKKVLDLAPPSYSNSASQNLKTHQGQDLNLAYPPTSDHINISSFAQTNHSFFMPMPASDTNTIYPSGFPLQEFKPTLNFSMGGFEGAFGGSQGAQETSARLFFPFEDSKEVLSASHELEPSRGQGEPNGYWNGMLGGGTAW